jgi:nucleoid-associated protein YgaU
LACHVGRHRRSSLRRGTLKAFAASSLLSLAVPFGFAGPAEAAPPACRSHELGAVSAHVREAANDLACAFGIRTAYGHRSGGGDHSRGLAVDFMTMTDPARGDRLAAHALANASRYRIQYVMWNHRIWDARQSGKGWRWVPDRGSRTANHMDHVHVSFSRSGGGVPTGYAAFRKARAAPRVSAASAPGVHSVRSGDTLSSIARRYRINGGYPALLRANRSLVIDPNRIYVGQQLRIPR